MVTKTTATQSTYFSNYRCLYEISKHLSPSKVSCDGPSPGLRETSLAKGTRLAVRVILNSFVARVSIVAGAIFEGLVLDFVWKGTESIWSRLSFWVIDKIVSFHSWAVWENWPRDKQRFGWPGDTYLGTTKTRLALYYWYIVVGVWQHFPVVIKGLLTFGAGFLSSGQILAVLILGARGSIRDDAIFSGEDISVRKFTSRAFFRNYLPLRISPRVECYPWVSDDAPYCIVNHQRSPLQITINQWKENRGSEISKILRHLSFTIFAGFENDFLSLPAHIPSDYCALNVSLLVGF